MFAKSRLYNAMNALFDYTISIEFVVVFGIVWMESHQSTARLKGWVLCDADGLCLVALRETAAYFYENRLLFSAAGLGCSSESSATGCGLGCTGSPHP